MDTQIRSGTQIGPLATPSFSKILDDLTGISILHFNLPAVTFHLLLMKNLSTSTLEIFFAILKKNNELH